MALVYVRARLRLGVETQHRTRRSPNPAKRSPAVQRLGSVSQRLGELQLKIHWHVSLTTLVWWVLASMASVSLNPSHVPSRITPALTTNVTLKRRAQIPRVSWFLIRSTFPAKTLISAPARPHVKRALIRLRGSNASPRSLRAQISVECAAIETRETRVMMAIPAPQARHVSYAV